MVLDNNGRIDPEKLGRLSCARRLPGAAQGADHERRGDLQGDAGFSGLRGRGGAGFPTGLKWDLTRKVQSDVKYVICNGDEGDPGAFMDRSVLEGDPQAVIEGMLIAARAMHATNGVFYIRAEYPLAVERMEKALRRRALPDWWARTFSTPAGVSTSRYASARVRLFAARRRR